MGRVPPGPSLFLIHNLGDGEMTSKVYDIVTAKILDALEAGTVPWHKPWSGGLPRNAVTNKTYRGVCFAHFPPPDAHHFKKGMT